MIKLELENLLSMYSKRYFKSIIYTLLTVLFAGINLQMIAQTNAANSQNVEEIVSPVKNALIKSNDTSDVIIKIRNQGPNFILASDVMEINLSIDLESTGTIFSVDTSIIVGKLLLKDDFVNFKILNDYQFTQDDNYQICASVGGTRAYPINENKFNSACTPFSVGIREVNVEVKDVYFSNGKLFFNLKNIPNANMEIYDMTGKLLLEKGIKASDQFINFDASSKGFYFIKVYNRRLSTTAVAKFAVN